MGHQAIQCDFCRQYVMEGHLDWECNCGAICSEKTQWMWKKDMKPTSLHDLHSNNNSTIIQDHEN